MTINYGARIGSNNEFFAGGSISAKPQDLKFKGEDTICEIGDNNSFRENVNISRGTASKGTTQIGNNCLLMENVHAAHDCFLGNNLIIGNSTKIAGEVVVDDFATISGAVLFHQFIHIGGYVMIQGGSRSPKDIPPYIMAGREPIRYSGINIVGLRRRGFTAEQIELIHNTYRILYSGGVMSEAIAEVEKQLPQTDEVKYILDFVRTSSRGIIR